MAAMTSLALGLGAAASIGGTIMGAMGQMTMAKEQKEATTKAENAREAQMMLDASRRRRQAFRESLLARSTALTVGTAQGAGQGSSVAGAMAQATATGQQNQQTTNAAADLGSQVFQANREYAAATAKGQSRMAMGSALSSLGGMMMSQNGTINRLGNYYMNRPYDTPQYG